VCTCLFHLLTRALLTPIADTHTSTVGYSAHSWGWLLVQSCTMQEKPRPGMPALQPQQQPVSRTQGAITTAKCRCAQHSHPQQRGASETHTHKHTGLCTNECCTHKHTKHTPRCHQAASAGAHLQLLNVSRLFGRAANKHAPDRQQVQSLTRRTRTRTHTHVGMHARMCAHEAHTHLSTHTHVGMHARMCAHEAHTHTDSSACKLHSLHTTHRVGRRHRL
jgi:hypothetical protein